GPAARADVHQSIAVTHSPRVARHRMARIGSPKRRWQAKPAAPLRSVCERSKQLRHVIGGGSDVPGAEGDVDPGCGCERHPERERQLVGRLVALGIGEPIVADDGAMRASHSERRENPLLIKAIERLSAKMLDQLAEDVVTGVRIMPVLAGSISGPKAALRECRGIAGDAGDMVEQMLDLDGIACWKRDRRKQ